MFRIPALDTAHFLWLEFRPEAACQALKLAFPGVARFSCAKAGDHFENEGVKIWTRNRVSSSGSTRPRAMASFKGNREKMCSFIFRPFKWTGTNL